MDRLRPCALVVAVATGCSVVTDLEPLRDADGGGDASTEGSVVVDASVDAPEAATDAGLESSSDGAVDAADGATACALGAPLVGSGQIGSNVLSTTSGTADAFGYVAPAAGTAGCVWVYFGTANSGVVHLGVYSHSAINTAPQNLRAKALISSPKPGWNGAPLDAKVTFATSDNVWIAVLPVGGAPTITFNTNCGTKALSRASRSGVTTLPSPFATTSSGTECTAALYLSL